MNAESAATEPGEQAQANMPAAEIGNFAYLELFGHRRDCGRLREVRLADRAFLQVERLCELLPAEMRFTLYSGAAIYSVRPCSEQHAVRYAQTLAREHGLTPASPALQAGPAERPLGEDGRRCKECGCTTIAGCMPPEGPCSWVEPDLCSACEIEDDDQEDDDEGPDF